MFPDDRVLVGVLNRKRDLKTLLEQRWYRIPEDKMPFGVYAEYIALFLSGSAAKSYGDSGVYLYARRKGVELALRKDLLPNEPDHKNAEKRYYKVQLHPIEEKHPPLLNNEKRVISFIYTTWDRFIKSEKLSDLYSHEDYFVDRIYHALRDRRVKVRRFWDADRDYTGIGAHLRVMCEQGPMVASTEPGEDVDVYLENRMAEDALLARVLTAIKNKGGPVVLSVPLD